MYDAAKSDEEFKGTPSDDEETFENLKLIDFAHTVYDSNCSEPDHDLLNGLKNLILSLETIVQNPQIEPYCIP